MTKTVVILGAGWAGLPLAHKLLKYTAPKIDIKVILVSPNSHFFWNVAATRGIIPGEIPNDQLFLPIEPAFAKYSSDDFEFVLGAAEAISTAENVVSIIGTRDGAKREIYYDQMIIATGSRLSSDLPLKPLGSHETTLAAWGSLQQQVSKADSIVIAGAGATGVEVAGELAAKYGKAKKISLVVSGTKLLESETDILPSIRTSLDNDLNKLDIRVIRNARVTDVKTDSTTNGQLLTLSNGSTVKADCYLPLYGLRINTSFVPSDLLDAEGSVKLDPTMRVHGTENIWAIGDAGDIEGKKLTVTDNQIVHLASAIDAVLTGIGAVKPYQPAKKTMIFLALGTHSAAGQIGSWKLFRFLTSYVKGRKLFVDTAEGYVAGKHLRHAAM